MSRVKTMCLLATLLALSVSCSAQSPRVMAEKLYDQLNQAFANHDLNQMLSFFDSSFVSTDARGKRVEFTEFRKNWEQAFAKIRHMNPSTTVKDVQLEAGRMVVYSKTEMHYELRTPGKGWVPQIIASSGEETWARRGGEWKLVRGRIFRTVLQVDPKWEEENSKDWDMARRVIECCDNRPH